MNNSVCYKNVKSRDVEWWKCGQILFQNAVLSIPDWKNYPRWIARLAKYIQCLNNSKWIGYLVWLHRHVSIESSIFINKNYWTNSQNIYYSELTSIYNWSRADSHDRKRADLQEVVDYFELLLYHQLLIEIFFSPSFLLYLSLKIFSCSTLKSNS